MEGKLAYTIRGAKTAALEVAMPDWELDSIGPDNLVAGEGVSQNGGAIAISLAQPTSGTVELQLRAHRALKAGANSFRVRLPQPLEGSSGPASLAVLAADNMELTPNDKAIEGLTRQRFAPPMKLPQRQQDPLYYRGAEGAAVFAADFRLHPQRITVDVATRATLGQHTATVEQRQSYSIAYEPADRLTIAVPRQLATAQRLRVLCDGKPLTTVAVSDELSGGDAAAPVAMQVALPSPRLGNCELVLQYSAAVVEPVPDRPSSLSLPLPMPQDGQLLKNTFTIATPRATLALPRKGGVWMVIPPQTGASGSQGVLRLSAEKPEHRVDLNLRWQADNSAGVITIDRAWLQSWLTSSARQDRAAYQLTTNRKELEVTLPADAAADEAVVLVDGKRVEAPAAANGRLLIPLPGPSKQRRVAIELRYQFPGPRLPRGTLSLSFPQFGPNAWVRRMYWQLVLPANEHVMANPDGFTSEFTWDWQGYFWGRRPLLDQPQLEEWAGAAPAPLCRSMSTSTCTARWVMSRKPN